MSEQHTTGLLKLHTKYPKDIVTPDGHYTVARTLPQPTIAVAVANARRLVACWNACEGISTDELETTGGAAVGWVRTASKLMHVTKQHDELLEELLGCIARAAIAKAEGGAA